MTEIGPGNLCLEENVPAQAVLLVGGVLAPIAWTDQEIVFGMLALFRPHTCWLRVVPRAPCRRCGSVLVFAEPSVGPLGGDGQGRGRLLLGGRIEDGLAGGEPRQPVVDGL